MEYQWFAFSDECMKQAFDLRKEVFVEEQGFALEDEMDAQDQTSLHVLGITEQGPVCCARIFWQEPGVLHVGRVCVRRSCRGQGVGRGLMEEILRKAGELGARRAELGAQCGKEGFYETLGFSPFGNRFLDAGAWHIAMGRDLREPLRGRNG